MAASFVHHVPIVTDEERHALLGTRTSGQFPNGTAVAAPADCAAAVRDALAPLVAEVYALREAVSSLRDQVAFLSRGLEILCREVERRHEGA